MKISKPMLVNSILGVVVAGAIAGSLLLILPAQASTDTEATQLTTTVQQGPVSTTISASGSIAAVQEVSASFAVSGTIASVDVALGDTVTAGQKLGTLDTTDLSAAVSEASSSLSSAYADRTSANTALAKAKKDATSSDPSVSQNASQAASSARSQLSSAEEKITTAAKQVAAAKADLADATLKAPIAGLVIAVNGTVGGSSSSTGGAESTTTGFVTIADVTKMTMTAAIAEADIADVEVGQTADVTFPALTDASTTATVTAIAPTATASNSVVTYATTITLDEVPEGLRLGQTAAVAITTVTSADDALYLPTAAITTASDGTSTVDVIGDDGESTTTTVELGVVGDQGTEITSGLEVGQEVVLGEVAAATDDATTTDNQQQGGGFGGGTGSFPGGGTPPTGGNR
ncbi:efflux RND transporter periplasmic adaptor subunit [Glaciihabitans arcticus]|uniref:Efflux RND transporter periplasmic adaptor subunit n=1 Tax=Glaciihabitans arcticus TaxID=2668039 RepID=A0A4Q9GSF3_9MICO|nr:efflux RND transporter periplasmic adaptor subunit [Glaciihabitans arcticus]TBN57932.1 efflux RND transporter periplasmic adaptor subunit [Glaciihabitans arcticus]